VVLRGVRPAVGYASRERARAKQSLLVLVQVVGEHVGAEVAEQAEDQGARGPGEDRSCSTSARDAQAGAPERASSGAKLLRSTPVTIGSADGKLRQAGEIRGAVGLAARYRRCARAVSSSWSDPGSRR
jgi:hypothetical protein